MSRKLSTTLTALTKSPTNIGVFESPAALSTVPKMMVAARGSMGTVGKECGTKLQCFRRRKTAAHAQSESLSKLCITQLAGDAALTKAALPACGDPVTKAA